MKGFTSSLMLRMPNILALNLPPDRSKELHILMECCEMSEPEALKFIERLSNIAYYTRVMFDDLFALFSNIHGKGFADTLEIKRLHSYGIPITRTFSQIYPEMEGVKIIPVSAIVECILALTNEGGLFYRK